MSLLLDLKNRIIVTQENVALTLGGTIDSTKAYFLDGNIDLGTIEIEIPADGINLKGYDFNTSGLYSTEDNYTMFTSPVGGSGDIVWDKLSISASGTNSKVIDVFDATGFHAYEVTAVNYNNCTDLGILDNYRQGLETGTGRFGGSPCLQLKGVWVGGFLVTNSIVRGMSDTTTEPLFKAGAGFLMSSRFKTNINVDLGTLQPFCDFASSNFVNPSTLQIKEAEITRDGIYNPDDSNILPNITNASIKSDWKGNNGIENTHVGGVLTLTGEVATTISIIGDYYTLAGTYTSEDLQHFDNPINGQVRNIGSTPREFKIITYIVIDGSANDVISIRLRKYDSSTTTTSTIVSQLATVNNFSGANDRCTFSILGRTTLDMNDYYFIEVANMTSTDNVTSKLGTFTTIEERA
jgi:hypothetical protein